MPLFTLLMAVGNIFGQGGSSLISRSLGHGDSDGVRRVSSFCFYITAFLGIAIGAAMLIFRTPMLYVLGADADTFFHASGYYTYISAGARL